MLEPEPHLFTLPLPPPPLQPWYEHLESLRHLLPEEEAKDKATGESWPAKLMRLADRQLDALAAEESK